MALIHYPTGYIFTRLTYDNLTDLQYFEDANLGNYILINNELLEFCKIVFNIDKTLPKHNSLVLKICYSAGGIGILKEIFLAKDQFGEI